jgi:hypothetical protein
MKRAAKMTSDDIICIPSSMTICLAIQVILRVIQQHFSSSCNVGIIDVRHL